MAYYPAQAEAETASDPESINKASDQFPNENLIQEEQEQLRMERQEQEFDAFGVDKFNKNDDPRVYEFDDEEDLGY